MKKLTLSIVLIMLLVSVASAQSRTTRAASGVPQKGPRIEFSQRIFNFDTIKTGKDISCTFLYKNVGNEPLIISDARASCGCTTPSYSSKPLMPGQTGQIKVTYNSAIPGPFLKTVVVISNAINNQRQVLRIKGIAIENPK